MNPLLLIGGMAAAAYYFAAKQFASEAKFKVRKVQFDKKKSQQYLFTQLFFNVTGEINNPAKFQMQVNSIHADVFYQDKRLAQIERSESFTILPEKIVQVVCSVQVDTLTAFSSVAVAAQALDNLPELLIKGTVNLQAGVLSINEVIKVTA